MTDRWRARTLGLAIAIGVTAAAAVGVAWAAGSAATGPSLTVRLPDGTVLDRVTLPADGGFTLRYRNSLYGSIAEERFIVDGARLRLVQLAADELPVLEEYYAIDRPARRAPAGDARVWTAEPAQRVALDSLTVAATDRGERTLVVGGSTVELWRLVDDGAASIVLEPATP